MIFTVIDSDYSSGDDDSDFEVPYSKLTAQEKAVRCQFLWHTAYLRAHGAVIILHKFSEMHQNILIYGTTKHINYDPHLAEREAYKRKPPCIILPDSRFMKVWNIIILLLLLYTATFLPIRTTFMDTDPPGLFQLELVIDILFFIDVYVNFVSAYTDRNTGYIEVSLRKIARNYLTSWFLLDLTACIPFQLM